MKKSTVIHLLVMICSLALSSYLAKVLTKEQARIAKSRSELAKTPIGGFNKFMSDIQWMLFVNYCGSLKGIDDGNVDDVYNRLNAIIRNDPDFTKAYKVGGLMLSVRAPVKSAEILVRGAMNPNLSDDWQIPYYAGYVLMQNVKDSDSLDVLKPYVKDVPLQRLLIADKLFRIAAKRPGGEPAISSYIRNRSNILKKRGRWKGNIKIVNDDHAYLCVCFDEWKNISTRDSGMGGNMSLLVNDISERLLTAIKDAKASAPNNKIIARTIKMVVTSALSDMHLCPECLTPYPPGAKYCSECGYKVKIYGVCSKCGHVVIGEYCSECGAKQEGSVGK